MVVTATLLNGELGANAVSSAEDQLGGIWVAGPVPGVLSEAKGEARDSLSITMN